MREEGASKPVNNVTRGTGRTLSTSSLRAMQGSERSKEFRRRNAVFLRTAIFTAVQKMFTLSAGHCREPMQVKGESGRRKVSVGCKPITKGTCAEGSRNQDQGIIMTQRLLQAFKTDTFDEFRVALTEWRNTPRFDGLSPAQWFLGYRQRTATPTA